MDLHLYNTLTRTKAPFRPLDLAHVRMYVCGPTVYDFAHIGNARPVIVFDVLYRLLRHLAKEGAFDGGRGETRVSYVRNITDVDDKINARAAERGVSIRDLTEETYANFKADVKALGCLPPTVEPRATEHIEEMKALIERLVAAGHAYVAAEHVLFSVGSMPDYGRLSRRPLDEMIAGARVEVAPYKREPMDFVLWKPSEQEAGSAGGATGTQQKVPAWPSPCGIATPGRPGWHIECSAMSWKHLGETFDIHGGGIDLVFPHHENEIAQSRCAFHSGLMAQVWMHNGFLQVEGEKMSKSLGNFVTIRELLATDTFGGRNWSGPAVRFAMLGTHYRQPIDWTLRNLETSEATLDDFFRLASPVETAAPSAAVSEALADDLNIPAAIAELHAIRKRIAHARQGDAAAELGQNLAFFGLDSKSYFAWSRKEEDRVKKEIGDIDSLIQARNAARKARNWAESDRIRDELAAMGVVLKDSKDGTTWEIAR